jgi:hypothetical protein
MAFSPAVIDFDVLAIDIAGFGETILKRCNHSCIRFGRRAVEISNDGHRRPLLRTRRERPCGSRAAEQRDELASL